jgi:hypothetical protein
MDLMRLRMINDRSSEKSLRPGSQYRATESLVPAIDGVGIKLSTTRIEHWPHAVSSGTGSNRVASRARRRGDLTR